MMEEELVDGQLGHVGRFGDCPYSTIKPTHIPIRNAACGDDEGMLGTKHRVLTSIDNFLSNHFPSPFASTLLVYPIGLEPVCPGY